MIDLKQLSPLGIGTSRVGSLGSRLSPDYFGAMLNVAVENKVNLIDTANAYGSGDAERLIGGCIRDNRPAFFVMTKAGIPHVHTPGWLSPLNQIGKKLKEKAGVRKNFTLNYLVNCLHKSTKRLDVEQVDAFMLHEPKHQQITDDSWAGLEKVRQLGLTRYTGVSTNDYQVVEAGIRAGQIQVVQTSAVWNNPSTDALINLCRQHRIPVVANSVLQGYKALSEPFTQKAEAIHRLAGLDGMSLVQLLIAAVLVQKRVDTVLIGTTNRDHMAHNLGAVRYTGPLSGQLDTLKQLLT